MIIGLDEDDGSVFQRTYDFLMENRISVPRIHILTPVPGTPLYDRMAAEGRLVSREFGRYSGGQVVFRPRRLDPEQLQEATGRCTSGYSRGRPSGTASAGTGRPTAPTCGRSSWG